MKVVKVRFEDGQEFLFQTQKKLAKGDLVLCLSKRKHENIGTCTCDSKEIAKDTLEFLQVNSRYTLPLAPIIGKLERWNEKQIPQQKNRNRRNNL